jgi:hypothetical protein
MHVGDLDAASASQGARKWKASVTIQVHSSSEAAVANATVTGSWSDGATGSGSCTTGSNGTCTVTKSNISGQSGSVTFWVTNVTHASLAYNQASNHDADGSSNGTTITVSR